MHAERDPDFGRKAAAQLDKRRRVIVYCGRGGTIKTGFGNGKKFFKDDPERAFGIETRSLKGCYELFEAPAPSFAVHQLQNARRADIQEVM